MSDDKVITPAMLRGAHPKMRPMDDNSYLALKGDNPEMFTCIQQALYEEEIPTGDWDVIGNLVFRIGYLHGIGYDDFRFDDDAEYELALSVYKRFNLIVSRLLKKGNK